MKQLTEKEQAVCDQLWSHGGWIAMVIIAHGASLASMVQSKDLKLRFFGEARVKGNSAQTSYNNKRKKACELNIIAPVEGAGNGVYSITDFGKKIIEIAEEKNINVAELKSKAQVGFKS